MVKVSNNLACGIVLIQHIIQPEDKELLEQKRKKSNSSDAKISKKNHE